MENGKWRMNKKDTGVSQDPLAPPIHQGCVKVAQNVTFSGRHGDLPLRELVGATLCGRPDLRNSTLTQSWPIHKVSAAVILILLFLLTININLLPQQLTESQVKSLLIRQIVDMYVVWPAETDMDNRDRPFVLGIVGESAFGRDLEQEYTRKQSPLRIRNKTVMIRKITQVEQIPGCNLLFVADLVGRLFFARMLDSTQNKSILTITDRLEYSNEGIQISFGVKETTPGTPAGSQQLTGQQEPKISLFINETAVQQAGLSIRNELLDDRTITIVQPFRPYLDKALLLAPITTFVTWPPAANMADPSKPFKITVIGDNFFDSYLDDTYQYKELKNKPVTIRYISDIKEINDTHLLFISKSMKNKISEIIAYTKNKPILTIGDSRGFCQAGVHVNFFYHRLELCFEINNEAARAVGLNLSWHLLQQAKIDTSD